MTRCLRISTHEATTKDHPALIKAGETVAKGGLVAFPTETVYGLGADSTNAEAVTSIFKAKGRPSDNPLIVHISNEAQLDELVSSVDPLARQLMDRFWPGPLTIVLPARPGALPPQVTAGLDTVAVRMPDHPVALGLLEAAGRPIAAPSANRSGRPSPTRAAHVLDDLSGRIDLVLDGGATGIGLESTVVEVLDGKIHILRPGGITRARLREAAGDAVIDPASGHVTDTVIADRIAAGSRVKAEPPSGRFTPRSPGMKYKHYAPQGKMSVVIGDQTDKVTARVQAELDNARRTGAKTGVLTYEEHASLYDADVIIACGRIDQPEETAKQLYASLRQFDEHDVEVIVAEAYPDRQRSLGRLESDLPQVIFNRLQKAASYRVIHTT